MRYKKIMFGIICIYYVKRTTSVVRITVRNVELKRTVTEKHTKTERHGNEAEKVSKETKTKEIEFMEGYHATVEHLGVATYKLEKVFKTNRLPRFPVDYLRKAITIDWEDNHMIKVHYRDLDESQVPKTKT